MQRLVLFGYIKISCLCKSFVCDGVRKDSAPRKCPVSFPRIAVSVDFPMRHTKLFKIGNSCPWSFPLFSDIHAYSAAKPSVPVVYCALHIRNCLVVEPTLHRIDADCLALFRIYPEFQFLFKVSGAGFKQSFGCSFAFRQKHSEPPSPHISAAFTPQSSGSIGLRFFSKLVHITTPYMQFFSSDRGFAHSGSFKPLYPASFRFRLTTDTLAFGCSYCQVCSGLSSPSRCPCRTNKKTGRRSVAFACLF